MNNVITAQKTMSNKSGRAMNSMKQSIVHIYPQDGGIARYSEVISQIYKQQGIPVTDVTVDMCMRPQEIVRQFIDHEDAILHFEVGAGDGAIFAAARKSLDKCNNPQIMTIHDSGIFVRHPFDNKYASSDNQIVMLLGKIVRKIISLSIGSVVKGKYVESPRVTTVYLRPDLATAPRAFYLPHPTFHQAAAITRNKTNDPHIAGFGGYWGNQKGLETVIEAWASNKLSDMKLIVSGGVAGKQDSYATDIKQQLQTLTPAPELPGFIDDIDSFLRGLDVLLLPYWPDLPNGTSAMALRAAELGVPIIASNTPALREQLGEDGAIYIEPKNSGALVGALKDLEHNWEQVQRHSLRLSKSINIDHSWCVVGERLSEIVKKTT